jgi:hypothetical protein
MDPLEKVRNLDPLEKVRNPDQHRMKHLYRKAAMKVVTAIAALTTIAPTRKTVTKPASVTVLKEKVPKLPQNILNPRLRHTIRLTQHRRALHKLRRNTARAERV